MSTVKFLLPEDRIPEIMVQTSRPTLRRMPLRRAIPVRHQPLGPDDLAPLFPMALIMQEVSREQEIEIPEEVREIYRQWRPTPPVPRPPVGKGAGYAGKDLLQVRRGQSHRLTQT